MRKVRGFTLIELVIVMTVAVILTAVAVSAYSKQARKSRRYDAVSAIASTFALQQRYRANHATFGDMGAINAPTESTGKNYDISMQVPPSSGTCTVGTKADHNSFQITATAKNDQLPDSGCATFVLTNMCGVVKRTSTGGETCWTN